MAETDAMKGGCRGRRQNSWWSPGRRVKGASGAFIVARSMHDSDDGWVTFALICANGNWSVRLKK